jgi:putative endonuclease
MAITVKRQLGNIGENIACEFLIRRGFKILGRNYEKKWGELDVIAEKKGIIHFVEVKSVSCVTLDFVTHETNHRPEDNMHPLKLKRLVRTMQSYMLEKNLDNDFQLDLVTVRIDKKRRVGRAEIIENIIVV